MNYIRQKYFTAKPRVRKSETIGRARSNRFLLQTIYRKAPNRKEKTWNNEEAR
jgi:hypothetical protein